VGHSPADDAPLWKLLSKHVDEKLMDAIAASGAPGALDLVRKILIASAAIPAAFPPVLIDVEVNGKRYQEMHVDGGAMTRVFLYPASMRLREQAEAEGIVRERRAYIIRNARLDPDWSQVDRRTLSIAGRGRLQRRLHSLRLRRARSGGLRPDVHEGAVRARLRTGPERIAMAQVPARLRQAHRGAAEGAPSRGHSMMSCVVPSSPRGSPQQTV
jgi:hypothetical protein